MTRQEMQSTKRSAGSLLVEWARRENIWVTWTSVAIERSLNNSNFLGIRSLTGMEKVQMVSVFIMYVVQD